MAKMYNFNKWRSADSQFGVSIAVYALLVTLGIAGFVSFIENKRHATT
jgi:hypothetical protein